uniref:Uncharacterized protein n=1 Tax=Ditylenchus dipsaci TaxID=166011 RepID=A0A915CZB1_9BILA
MEKVDKSKKDRNRRSEVEKSAAGDHPASKVLSQGNRCVLKKRRSERGRANKLQNQALLMMRSSREAAQVEAGKSSHGAPSSTRKKWGVGVPPDKDLR